MGKYVAELEKRESTPLVTSVQSGVPARKPRTSVFRTVGIVFIVLSVVGTIAGYFYWQHLKSTPQYSLALIVDAAKRDDQATVGELVDIDSVVDDFLPQITGKAIELFGRGLPAEVIQRVTRIAAPVMPAVKERARDELPGAIRQKTANFGDIPFPAMVLGADRYLEISIEGDTANVTSKVPDHDFSIRMERTGDRWKISAVKDDELATRIAQRIGQEVVAIAVNGTGSSRSRLGVKNINELLREAEDLFK